MTSKVSFQVMWNRLISIVEEQAQALVRTAFSTSVREAGDLSAGVYNRKGEMIAQAVTGTPGHVNAMADSVAHFIRRIQAVNMFEGDIYITNDHCGRYVVLVTIGKSIESLRKYMGLEMALVILRMNWMIWLRILYPY